MGVLGASSALKNDPNRFCEKFTLNWDDDDNDDRPNENNNLSVILLIDSMSLLHHIVAVSSLASSSSSSSSCFDDSNSSKPTQTMVMTSRKKQNNYYDLGTLRRRCITYIQNLLNVLNDASSPPHQGEEGGGSSNSNSSSIHFFFDGLNPKAKIETQLDRYTRQGLIAAKIAKGGKTNNNNNLKSDKKILHHFAQWAFQEAIEELINQQQKQKQDGGKTTSQQKTKTTTTSLFIHRPPYGEGEAHINYWISQNNIIDNNNNNNNATTKLAIISEDSDFMIYDSCPGFIPPQTIQFELNPTNGKHCLQGQLFSRKRFLQAYFPDLLCPTKVDPLILTTVAAIAGCDYTYNCSSSNTSRLCMDKLRNYIIKSDIGGLRLKYRKNPTAAQAFMAIVRYINHFVTRQYNGPNSNDGDDWLHTLIDSCCGGSGNGSESSHHVVLYDMIQSIHIIYYEELQVSNNHDLTNEVVEDPGMIDVRRLLDHGIVYCYPVIETDTISTRQLGAISIVSLPPSKFQMKSWMEDQKYSVWMFPHFRLFRIRLYAMIRNYIKENCGGGGSSSKNNISRSLNPIWSLGGHGSSSSSVDSDEIKVTEYCFQGQQQQQKSRGQQNQSMIALDIKIPHCDTIFLSGCAEPPKRRLADVPDDDDITLERFISLTLFGTSKLNSIFKEHEHTREKHMVTIVCSMMLPYNLAALLILLRTAPRSCLDNIISNHPPTTTTTTNEDVQNELDCLLPLVDVAMHHAILLCGTTTLLFSSNEKETADERPGGGYHHSSSSSSSGYDCRLSDIFDFTSVRVLWGHMRLLDSNLEDVADNTETSKFNDDAPNINIVRYMEDVFTALQTLKLNNDDVLWENALKVWKDEALFLWGLWWHACRFDDLKPS